MSKCEKPRCLGHNTFLTLTYDDEHLPENNSVDVRVFQLFAKKLRNKFGPFRYYHCGEYGDESDRAHYHVCLFGLDFIGDRYYSKTTDQGDKLYESPSLDECWGMGKAWIGELTFKSAAYVARYVMKSYKGSKESRLTTAQRYSVPTDQGFTWLRNPPYASMSRRPGIGAKWIEKFHGDVYPGDFVVIDEQKQPVPGYYDQYLERINPQLLEQLKKERAATGRKFAEDNTPERLAVREEILKRKQEQKPRK